MTMTQTVKERMVGLQTIHDWAVKGHQPLALFLLKQLNEMEQQAARNEEIIELCQQDLDMNTDPRLWRSGQ